MSTFHIRQATPEDALGMARVRVDTWRATYRGIVPDEFLENMSSQKIAERWKKTFWENPDPSVGFFTAENGQNEIIGIAFCGPERSGDPLYKGEVYVLYVLPSQQRQGIGGRLMSACARHLLEVLQVNTMLVWVAAENPYRRFYEVLGGNLLGEKMVEIGGKMISEVGYGWEDIHPLL